jgi:ribulose-bisphosphate carboxylase large chain
VSCHTSRWATGSGRHARGQGHAGSVPDHVPARVDPEQAAAAIAGAPSTRDLTGGVDQPADGLCPLKAKAYRLDPVPGIPAQYFTYIVYDRDLFEEGSIANLSASIIGNVFGFKPLKRCG